MPIMSPFVRHANERSLLSKLNICQGKNNKERFIPIPQDFITCSMKSGSVRVKLVIVQWRIHGLRVGNVQKIYTLGLKFRECGEFQGDILYYYNVAFTNVELIHHRRVEKKKEKKKKEGCGGGVWRREGRRWGAGFQTIYTNTNVALNPSFPFQSCETKSVMESLAVSTLLLVQKQKKRHHSMIHGVWNVVEKDKHMYAPSGGYIFSPPLPQTPARHSALTSSCCSV